MDTRPDLVAICVRPDGSIRDAIACIDRNGQGVALVTDAAQRLLGVITDGDIRRAILAGVGLSRTVDDLLEQKKRLGFPSAITIPAGTDRAGMLRVMRERGIRQIPVLDQDGRVIELVTLDKLLPDQVLPLGAVIMAGGQGTRLRPLTEDLPKPMLPVGDRPLMERMIEQLRQSGIRQMIVTTHYKPEKIVEHFGDGHKFGVELNYVTEDAPLGTAGALGLLPVPTQPLLVINGDILTRVDFRAMLAFHQEQKAALTVAVRQFDLNLPYGVLELEGPLVQNLVEKPLLNFFVNAGIYLMEPTVQKDIPSNQRFDMTDLIQRLLRDGQRVAAFPVVEYWLDIGRHADYEQAQQDAKNGRLPN